MPFPPIDPIAFAIGPLVVRWYALAYLAGIGFGVFYGQALLRNKPLWRKNTPPFSPADWLDFAFWAMIGIVIGGRMGYVLFYNPLYFAQNPLAIIGLSSAGGAGFSGLQGMSFHGGAIGMLIAITVFCRSKNASLLSGMDLVASVAPIALFLGRIANFINAELYGAPTSLPWGVVFPGTDGQPRHPSQLYEALLEGLLLFAILRFVTHVGFGLRRPGLAAGLFGILYGLARIGVEGVRLPDAHIGYLYGGWLTLGMVYSLPMLLAGIGLLIHAMRRENG